CTRDRGLDGFDCW
nr:immunoglobulin heavy chain junction region [Macaca mulatta]